MSRRVLAAHLRTMADGCAADRDATPLSGDQPAGEYEAAYDRIQAMRSSAFRLDRRADDLTGGDQ